MAQSVEDRLTALEDVVDSFRKILTTSEHQAWIGQRDAVKAAAAQAAADAAAQAVAKAAAQAAPAAPAA